jgi:hypothetical protein
MSLLISKAVFRQKAGVVTARLRVERVATNVQEISDIMFYPP